MNLKTIKAPRPTVVVIIPFYNGADWVERAIRSVVAQTVQPDEFIIVNDGSKPEERAALGRLAENYPFSIIDKENGGQGSARNAGVSASTSDFICFLDQDDFYLENHIDVLTRNIPRDDCRFGFVYADLYEADGDGNVVRMGMIKDHATHPKRNITDLLRNDMFVLPSASLISRKAFEAVGGFDPQFMGYEDDDLFMRLFRKGYSHRFIDKPVTVWCIHPESTSYGIRMVRSRFRYFKKLAGLFPDDPTKSRFYFRDCLVPRFGQEFIKGAAKAVKAGSPNQDELVQILVEYSEIVASNPSIDNRYKKRLRLMAWALSSCPRGLLLTARKMTGLPFVRRFIA